MQSTYLKAIKQIATSLASANIPYQFTGASALIIQGVTIEKQLEITLSVQWDVFQDAKKLFSSFPTSETEKNSESAFFQFKYEEFLVVVSCLFNTTIKTNPYRISVAQDGEEIWCESLYHYLYNQEMAAYSVAIHAYLASEQRGFTAENEAAWNQNNYLALVQRYGTAEQLSPKLKQNPKWRLYPFYRYFGDLHEKKVTHLMGSNGVKAVAMALLGASVKVVDFSQENAAYAKELATSSGVTIEYIVSDVLSLSAEHVDSKQDFVLMELGVLHYLIDLQPLLEKIKGMLKPGGQFILHEFHPISTKLITSTGKKHKVTGNYFDPAIERNTVAFSKHMPDEEQENLSQVVQRKWTIGELVTAVGQSGLIIKLLEEEPNHKLHDAGLPKTYTLVAEKSSI